MWQEAKKKELQERMLVQDLYRDLIGQVDMNKCRKKVSFACGGNVAILFLKQ